MAFGRGVFTGGSLLPGAAIVTIFTGDALANNLVGPGLETGSGFWNTPDDEDADEDGGRGCVGKATSCGDGVERGEGDGVEAVEGGIGS